MAARKPDTKSDTPAQPEPPAEQSEAAQQLARLLAAAADEAAARPVVVDAEAEDPDGDSIEFVRTGIVRITIAGKRYRLRRPFFGELRTLRGAYQEAMDELGEASDEVKAQLAAIRAEFDGLPEADRKGSEAAYTRRIRKVNRDLEALQEDAYLAWWGQAFDMLAMEGHGPGVEEMPAWMASDTPGEKPLIVEVLNHWRSNPLARGSSANGEGRRPRLAG